MKFSRRTLSLLLACMLALSMPAYAMGYSYATTYTLGQDTVLTQMVSGNNSGKQRVQFISYTPNESVQPVIAYGSSVYGLQDIQSAAAQLESRGMDVIGGINADYFVTSTGVPIGVIISEGQLISSDAWQQAVGFRADGSAVIGQPQLAMSLYGANGSLSISYFNKTRSAAGAYLLDHNYHSSTLVTQPGVNVVMERLDEQDVAIGNSLHLRVTSIDYTDQSTAIGENQMILTINNQGPIDSLPPYQVGDELTLSISAPNSQWNDVVYAVGAKEVLVHDSVAQQNGTATAPRSAVGVKADGTVVLYEADGRRNGTAVGLSLNDLALEMLAMGCVQAVNLDGGGSSALIAQMPGSSATSVVNTPSDGALRRCSTFIMLVNNAPVTGDVAHLTVYPADQYLMAGASTTLTAAASDSGYHPVTVPGDVSFSASSGTVNGQSFTAGNVSETVTLSAQSGSATGTGTAFVFAQADTIRVYREGGSTTPVTTLSLQPGQSVDLTAQASYLTMPLAGTDELFSWSVTGDIGSVDEKGTFTASDTRNSGTLFVTYGGITNAIAVTLGLPPAQDVAALACFESTQPFTGAEGQLALTQEFGSVRFGSSALSANLDAGESVLTIPSPIAVSSLFTHIQLWLQSDGAVALSAQFVTDSGTVSVPLSAGVSQSGFTRYEGALPQGVQSFGALSITSQSKQTVALDHITVSSGALTDTTAPELTRLSASYTVAAGQSATILWQVTEESGSAYLPQSHIRVTVDGTEQSYSYTPGNGQISVSTAALSAGLHRVSILAENGAGYLVQDSVDVTAGAAADAFADVTGHWAAPYVAFVSGKGLIAGSNDGGVVSFRPDRDLTRAEFAIIIARYLQLDDSDQSALSLTDDAALPTWARGAIGAVYRRGIMTGRLNSITGALTFDPTASITRAEVMTVLGKMLPQGHTVTALSHTDGDAIPTWALSHVNYLTSLGIIGGYEDGSIRPLNPITRGEIAKILYTLY